MKPRIIKSGPYWLCYSPAIFGGRIVGYGRTVTEAYRKWSASHGPAVLPDQWEANQ